jgi:hypothetical protein
MPWYQTIHKDRKGKKQQRKENFRDVARIVDPEFWTCLQEGVGQELENTAFEMEKSRENVEQSWSVLKTSGGERKWRTSSKASTRRTSESTGERLILFSWFIHEGTEGARRRSKYRGQTISDVAVRGRHCLTCRDARRPSKDVTSGIRIQSEMEV